MQKSHVFEPSIPVSNLAIVSLQPTNQLARRVNEYIVEWRKDRINDEEFDMLFPEYKKDTYIIGTNAIRFGTGEGKGSIDESVRGKDLFILADITNYSGQYKMRGDMRQLSPDDLFQDLKRIISAAGGKPKRINVIMPFLYESRRHIRNNTSRESLDCALALKELNDMGVENIITFDAHEPRVQNAIPLSGFENIQLPYQFIETIFKCAPDLKIDGRHFAVIAPDEGAMPKAVYYANVLGIDMGMFFKRIDYSTSVNGQNPVLSYEFLGDSVEGKDVMIVDDMISSGGMMVETARDLKRRGAGRIFIMATFGFFTNGLEKFDKAFEEGIFDKLLTTNSIYQSPELFEREYYVSVDVSEYIALIIDSINHDHSISKILNPSEHIRALVESHNNAQK